MTINILTIECAGVAGISARSDSAGQAFTKVTLEDPNVFELITSLVAQVGYHEILDHIVASDIELYMKGEGASKKGVTVTVDGNESLFTGDELTSPLHQAEAFISKLAKKKGFEYKKDYLKSLL